MGWLGVVLGYRKMWRVYRCLSGQNVRLFWEGTSSFPSCFSLQEGFVQWECCACLCVAQEGRVFSLFNGDHLHVFCLSSVSVNSKEWKQLRV